jgi:hypothetical protein
VKTPHKSYRVYLARGKRDSWGREDRERVIVFGEVGNSFYHWTEFVETDTEHFAAPIPNPEQASRAADNASRSTTPPAITRN